MTGTGATSDPAATRAVGTDFCVTAAYPARLPVTLTVIRLPSMAGVSKSFDAWAPVTATPEENHWKVSVAPTAQIPGRTASCLPTEAVPTIVGVDDAMLSAAGQTVVARTSWDCGAGVAATAGARASVNVPTTITTEPRKSIETDTPSML
jgi:hypothetical protein